MERNIREIWYNGQYDKVIGYRAYITYKKIKYEKCFKIKEDALKWITNMKNAITNAPS